MSLDGFKNRATRGYFFIVGHTPHLDLISFSNLSMSA